MKTLDTDKTGGKSEKMETFYLESSPIVAFILQNELSLHKTGGMSTKQKTEDFWKQICLSGNC